MQSRLCMYNNLLSLTMHLLRVTGSDVLQMMLLQAVTVRGKESSKVTSERFELFRFKRNRPSSSGVTSSESRTWTALSSTLIV